MSSTASVDALKRALNGDRDALDPPTRRGLFAVAAETDELRDDTTQTFASIERSLDRTRKVGYGVITSTIGSAILIIITATGS